ncbi:ATPase, partial [candidate division KSB1 bacterium]
MKKSDTNRKLGRAKLLSFTILFATVIILTFILAAYTSSGAEKETQPQAATQDQSSARGMGFLAAALSTGLSVLGAGFAVAQVGTAAVGAVAEKPELVGRTLIYVGLAEGLAIYGL